MVVMSKYGMRFLNTVIKIRFDRSDHSSIPLTYGAFHFLQMDHKIILSYNSAIMLWHTGHGLGHTCGGVCLLLKSWVSTGSCIVMYARLECNVREDQDDCYC